LPRSRQPPALFPERVPRRAVHESGDSIRLRRCVDRRFLSSSASRARWVDLHSRLRPAASVVRASTASSCRWTRARPSPVVAKIVIRRRPRVSLAFSLSAPWPGFGFRRPFRAPDVAALDRPAAGRRFGRQVPMVFQDPMSVAQSHPPRLPVGRSKIVPRCCASIASFRVRGLFDRSRSACSRSSACCPDMASRRPRGLSASSASARGLPLSVSPSPDHSFFSTPWLRSTSRSRPRCLTACGTCARRLPPCCSVAHSRCRAVTVQIASPVMYLGRILEIGRATRSSANPRHPYTQAF